MRINQVFLFFFCCTFVLYYPAREGRFVFDFIDWYAVYEQQGWHGLLVNFNDCAFRPILHIIGYSLHVFFGLHTIAWLFTAAILHAATATVLVSFLLELLKRCDMRHPFFIACFSSMLFLLSPYQTEVVIWGGAFFYLFAAFVFVVSLYYFARYTGTGRPQYLYLYFLFFLLAVLCHEIAFTMPLLVILFILFIPAIDTTHRGKVKLIAETALPIFLFVPVYLFIDKLVLGQWIGHYGAAVHLHADLREMLGKLNMYVAKFYLFARFWRPQLYQWAVRPKVLYLSGFLICMSIFALVLQLIKNSIVRNIIVFSLATIIMLALVLNLYLPDFVNIHGDRLGYFASLFVYVPFCIILSRLPKVIAYTGGLLFLFVSLYFLHINVNSWHQAAKLSAALDTNFLYDSANHLYILNLPDNYNGAYMYRCRAEGKFGQKQKMLTGRDFKPHEIDVLSVNLFDPSDSVTVEKLSDSTLKVTLNQWGRWFWRDTYGASSYEDSLVKVQIDDWNHSYIATFRHKEQGDIYLYQAGNKWNKVAGF